MDVASRWRLAVGVVRWGAPQPMLTAIVKATFRLDGPRPGILHEPPEPLGTDEAGDVGTDAEVERASDFAPRKARADVLVVGHAHAPEPCLDVHASFEVDGMVKRFRAAAGAPSTAIPLLSEYLARDADDDTPVQVAPRALRLPGWQGRVTSGFDFGHFNVAPPDQRLETLSSRAVLVLRGLLAGAAEQEVRLPGLEPAVFLVRSRDRLDAAEAVALVCDTLWIHTDRALCTLTWRGAVAAPPDGAYLVVDAGYGQAPAWPRVVSELGTVRWSKAQEESDRGPPASEVTRPARPLSTVALRATDDETTRTLPAPIVADELPTTIRKSGDNPMAQVLAEVELESEELVSVDEKAPETPRLGVVLGAGGGAALGGMVLGAPKSAALPFEAAGPAARSAPAPASAPPSKKRLGEETVAIDDAAAIIAKAQKEALPFRRAGSEPARPSSPELPMVDASAAFEPPRRQAPTAPMPPPPAPVEASTTPPMFQVPAHVAAMGKVGASTVTGEVLQPNLAPLPFGGSRPPPPPIGNEGLPKIGGETLTSRDETQTSRPWPADPPLPFRRSGMAANIPPPRAPSPSSSSLPIAPPPAFGAFAPPPPAPAPRTPALGFSPPPPLQPLPSATSAAAAKSPPAAPRTAAAAPPPPEPAADKGDLLPLETYAAVKVALLRGKALPSVLERHGLDEMSWRLEERRRADALSRAAERGDLSVVHTLRRAMREAQKKADEEDARK
jgi:uncharacterized protein DUF2169